MLEEEKQVELKENDKELNDAIDESMALLPLDQQEQNIIKDIIKAPNQMELQKQFDLFNMAQSKKNAMRVIKLNSLLDKVEDQAIERFEKRPDQVSNKEILEYMQVVSAQIDRSQKYMETIKDKPMIKATQNNNTEINVNIGTEITREDRDSVISAIQSLLKQVQNPDVSIDENKVVDAEVQEIEKPEPEEKIVYNCDNLGENPGVVNLDEKEEN